VVLRSFAFLGRSQALARAGLCRVQGLCRAVQGCAGLCRSTSSGGRHQVRQSSAWRRPHQLRAVVRRYPPGPPLGHQVLEHAFNSH